MSEEIRQIAERLVGLRDALDLRPEDIASTCNIDLETYLGYESGDRKSTRLNSSHIEESRMPSSA